MLQSSSLAGNSFILKAVSLGQQSSTRNARDVGFELLGSTLLGGLFIAVTVYAWVMVLVLDRPRKTIHP